MEMEDPKLRMKIETIVRQFLEVKSTSGEKMDDQPIRLIISL
jgi:hypothetical protein